MSRCVACILLECHFLRLVRPRSNKSHNISVSLSTDTTPDSWSDWEQKLLVLTQATSFVASDTHKLYPQSDQNWNKNLSASAVYMEFCSVRKKRILKTLNFVDFKYGRDSSAQIWLFSTRWLWAVCISIELFPEAFPSSIIKWGGSGVFSVFRLHMELFWSCLYYIMGISITLTSYHFSCSWLVFDTLS